ncbi:L-rhamnose mutarotase [Erwiniaceae bacterium BAC15a-03b]|uniref:L-rhamnose mutarotase n=1 Tax=Winslowiella arboricola TaxID=2978220 RepID=A0A9J6PQ76_9GAMM|nr:L-rhamnose mutarotase [Winslowiella arboricola]MCU5775564.1 L-rhamnose mutarotase [Winslowiella arboricola]MCU5779586.1 L-rhamnose mutarotase [Winslowiella arboricola]
MLRKAFVMQVYPQAHVAYQQRHAPIWPELEATLKQHGAHNYSIFLDAGRNLLFAYVEIESEARWAAVAQTDVCQRWWQSMRELMPSNTDNSPVSEALTAVFYLQ